MADEQFGISMEALSRRMVRETRQSHGYAGRRKGEPLRAWQMRLRKKLIELLAIDGRTRKPPQVRFVETDKCEGYLRRRGYMLAADGLDVPLYVLEPDPAPAGKMGVCIAAHGHGPGKVVAAGVKSSERAKELIEAGERDYGVQAVLRGYLTIVPDFRGFGELMFPDEAQAGKGNSCQQLSLCAMQIGKSLLGQKVSDVMQLLDWALARKDADRKRVVMTGNSHGGTMTLFSAAVDTRITACAPSCYFSTFAGSILAMPHCACNYVPSLAATAEMSDIGGLVAPRPMLIIAGTKDPIFPIDAVREGYANLQRIYRDAGAADRLELYEGDGAHRYYSARVWDFFREKLG
jgi:dienelactone hydrolase